MASFTGFDPAALDFLRDLGEHNDRAWFEAHRADYEGLLLLPARELVIALGERLAAIAPGVNADPRVNGSILRINRDTRFSNDKRPYKTHLDLWLWEGDGPSRASSGFFLRLEADRVGYGAGMHHFEKGMLAAYRAAVDDPKRGPALQRAVKKATASGALVGREQWKRVPAPYAADHPAGGAPPLRRAGRRHARRRAGRALHRRVPGLVLRAPRAAAARAEVGGRGRCQRDLGEDTGVAAAGRMAPMHSSYALSAEDFAVERNGSSEPLDTLWPGGWQPDDRLGVILAQPMDAVGCSNLICGTITLFYDLLREKHGTGNFFRYSDVFLFGVGCEPGDFNQLDVWPLHKFVSILQPSAEARHRGRERPPHHAARRARDRRALPRRGRPLDLEHVPRPGALGHALLAAHRARPATATSPWSATRWSRATSSRRSSRRRASTPASRRAFAACAATSTATRSSRSRRTRASPARRACAA